ncbi:hypothetical protein SAMN03159407_1230 [Rhizobium sp. NFR12]|nr:hypothetical protein SAMN03159407_1230 [Rhizobium sp. NFR12]
MWQEADTTGNAPFVTAHLKSQQMITRRDILTAVTTAAFVTVFLPVQLRFDVASDGMLISIAQAQAQGNGGAGSGGGAGGNGGKGGSGQGGSGQGGSGSGGSGPGGSGPGGSGQGGSGQSGGSAGDGADGGSKGDGGKGGSGSGAPGEGNRGDAQNAGTSGTPSDAPANGAVTDGPQNTGTQKDNAIGTTPETPDVSAEGRKKTSKNSRSLSVRHANGTTERISGDRYEMRDSRQRPIVNREATRSDRKRLETLSR